MLNYNQAGYGRATTEYELYKILESLKIGIDKLEKEIWIAPSCRIDYYGIDQITNKTLLIEVKNWFITIDNMRQLITYLVHATERYGENNFRLILIAGGIEKTRRKILEKLDIEVYLTKDLVQ